MKREFLAELGLEKEVIDKVMAENGKDLEQVKTTLTQERDNLQAELNKANEVLAGFEGVDVADLKGQIENYKQAVDDIRKDSAMKLQAMILNNAVNAKFAEVPEKYRKMLMSQVDMSKVTVNKDNSITGLDEQYALLKENYADLFQAPDTGLKFGQEQTKGYVNPERGNGSLNAIFGIKE